MNNDIDPRFAAVFNRGNMQSQPDSYKPASELSPEFVRMFDPPTESSRKAAPSRAESNESARSELQRFVYQFGEVKGWELFLTCSDFTEALLTRCAELQSEIDAISEQRRASEEKLARLDG